MPKPLLLAILLLAAHFGISQHESAPGIEVVCYANDHAAKTKVKHDRHVQRNVRSQGNAQFEFIFNDVVGAAANGVTRAAEIWSEVIYSDFPITIELNWVELADGVLGSARPASRERNFEGAPLRNVWYPIAMAEKMAGRELNDPDDPEIVINFSSEFTWYFETDGEPTEGTHDFLSVALHEIGHGLGLSDSYNVTADNGSYGIDASPTVYDIFIQNKDGEQLTDLALFNNPSTALKTQVTSGKLFFASLLAKAINADEFPRMFAPPEFDSGSSISHLDEGTYPAGDLNSLMTPQISRQEVIHLPGVLSTNILGEMGYVWATFDLDSIEDTRDLSNPVLASVDIVSDSALAPGKLFLHYSTDDFATEEKLALVEPEIGNTYTASIPAPSAPTVVKYYYSVEDVAGRVYTSPSRLDDNYHQFGFGLLTPLERISEKDIKVYPNPSQGLLYVGMTESLIGKFERIEIQNTLAQSLHVEGINPSKTNHKLDLQLPPGVYLLRLSGPKSVHTRKILVQ